MMAMDNINAQQQQHEKKLKVKEDENATEFIIGTGTYTKVLPKILRYLTFDSLLTVRQVCQSWNSTVCRHPLSAEQCVVTIRHSVDTAMELFSSATHPTFTNFRFITKSMNNVTPAQLGFWVRLGKTITYLDLAQHSLAPDAFLEVLLACPHLKELSFDCVPICLVGSDGQMYQKLIPNSPSILQSGILQSLECLHITNSNLLPPGVLSDLLEWSGHSGRMQSLSIMDEQCGIPHPRVRQLGMRMGMGSSKPIIPSWDVYHVLYLVQNQSRILTQLELCGPHIQPQHLLIMARMKYLKLRILKLNGIQADTQSLIVLFRRQKYLEELDLAYSNGVSEKAFLHPSCTFFKLRKLSLAGYTSHLDFLSFLSRMVNLVELNLSQSRSHSMTWDHLIHSFLPIKLRHLTQLDLSYSYGLGPLNRQNLFHSFINSLRTTLTCLNLSCNTCINNTYLQIVWHELEHLRILYLEQLPRVSDEGVTGIRQGHFYGNEGGGIKNGNETRMIIGYLNSSGVLRKHNKGAGHIGYCSNIETLSLADNQKLTDCVVQYGIRFLSNLKRLKLAGCSKITDRSVFFLIGSCPNLEYLDLRRCPHVTREWISWAENITTTSKLKILLDARPFEPVPPAPVVNSRLRALPLPLPSLDVGSTDRTTESGGKLEKLVEQEIQKQDTEEGQSRPRKADENDDVNFVEGTTAEAVVQDMPDTDKNPPTPVTANAEGKGTQEQRRLARYKGKNNEYRHRHHNQEDTNDGDNDNTSSSAEDEHENCIRIIMPRKYRLTTRHKKHTRSRNGKYGGKSSSGRNLVILTPVAAAPPAGAMAVAASTSNASANASASNIVHDDDDNNGNEDEPYKINTADGNNNDLKIPN